MSTRILVVFSLFILILGAYAEEGMVTATDAVGQAKKLRQSSHA